LPSPHGLGGPVVDHANKHNGRGQSA
jgi:hypothetical protein